jgi:RHS repeat-associated protein
MKSRIHRAALALAALAWGLWAATAQACPAGGGTCAATGAAPATLKLGAALNVGAGNPINVMSGNKYQREEDMPALPGVLGLEIVRHYNSLDSGVGSVPGTVGRGWRLSYETQLAPLAAGLQLIQADGSVTNFSRDVLRPAIATSADPANGVITIRRGRGGDEYLWRWTDGRELSFDHRGKLMQIKAASGEILSLLYDTHGLLVKVTDPQGRSLRLAYLDRRAAARGDRFRGVQSIDSPVGRYQYTYGSEPPPGSSVDRRSLLANLVRVGYPDAGRGRQYHYEDASHPTYLTGISLDGPGADGKAATLRYATYGYNAAGKGVLSTHAHDANKVTLDYVRPGVTILTNSLGQTTSYRYSLSESDYQLDEVRGAGCATCGPANVRYGYDHRGRLTMTTELDAQGAAVRATRQELDDMGRPLRVSKMTFEAGKASAPQVVQRFEYAQRRGVLPTLAARPSVIPGREVVTRTTYNDAGQALSVTEQGWRPAVGTAPVALIERTTRYRYRVVNGRSLLVAVDGPLPNGAHGTPADSDITLIEYDASGTYPVRTTAPGNLVSEVRQRDAALRPLLTVSSDGVRLVAIEDVLAPSGRLQQRTESAWLLDQQQPDAASRQVNTLRYRYDTSGELMAEIAPGRSMTRYRHDEAGNLTHVIAADQSQLARSYDTEGQLQLAFRYGPGGSGGQVEYQRATDDGFRIDAKARTVTQQWVADSAALAISNRMGTEDSAAARLVERVVREDGSEVRRWFDDFGRVVATQSPERGLQTAQYAASGAMLSLRDARGTTVTLRRDGQNRVLESSYSDLGGQLQQRIAYRYEGIALVREERWEQGRLDSRIEVENDVWGKAVGQTLSVFDMDGKPVAVLPTRVVADRDGLGVTRTLPSGAQISYRYDAAGRIGRIAVDGKTVVDAVRYAAAPGGMRPVAMDFGNGRRSLSQYAADGRLQSHANGVDVTSLRVDADGSSTVLVRRPMPTGAPARGWASALTALIGTAQAAAPDDGAAATRILRYDAMQRLVAESSDGVQRLSVSYSPLGDRLGLPAAEVDSSGNVVRHGAQTLAYNAAGELSRISEAGGAALASYRYDARGQRMAVREGDDQRYFLYQDGQLVAEAGANGRLLAEYIYLDQRPVARLLHHRGRGWLPGMFDGVTLEFLHTDTRDAVEAVSDADGKLVWRGELDAYGLLRSETGPRGYMPLRLSGQYADLRTGLHYNVHRYYDPASGRYLQADPLGLAAATNMYAYADNDPINKTDPLGLSTEPDEGGGIGRPWLFGTFVHNIFAEQVRAIGPGWGGNDGRNGTWTSLRPDAYQAISQPNGSVTGNLWELKPITWSSQQNPTKYAAGQAQVASYVKNAKSGCWSPGSGSALLSELKPPGTVLAFEGATWVVTYSADTANDKSGLIFYNRVKQQQKPKPSTVPDPVLAPGEKDQLDKQMQQIREQGAKEGWSTLEIVGMVVLIGLAIALMAAIAVFAGTIAAIIASIGAALAAAATGTVALITALAAIFALGSASAAAATAETKGAEKEQGLLDGTISWFKSWF